MSTSSPPSKGLHIALWIVQILAGAFFILVPGMMLLTPAEEVQQQTPLAAYPWLPPFISISEVLGGLGLLLPSITRIKPLLTPLAAAALAFVMVLAVGYHVVIDGKPQESGAAVLFFLLMVFVAWGRTFKAPIKPR